MVGYRILSPAHSLREDSDSYNKTDDHHNGLLSYLSPFISLAADYYYYLEIGKKLMGSEDGVTVSDTIGVQFS